MIIIIRVIRIAYDINFLIEIETLRDVTCAPNEVQYISVYLVLGYSDIEHHTQGTSKRLTISDRRHVIALNQLIPRST